MLTEITIKNAKPAAKPFYLADAHGLSLLIKPNGSKLWRYRYRFHGTAKMIGLGSWPEVPLKDARNRRFDARRELDAGLDPSAERKKAKLKAMEAAANSFEIAAEAFISAQVECGAWTAVHGVDARRRLERNIYPSLGSRPVSQIEPPELLDALKKVSARGATEMARRTRQLCSQVFQYAIAHSLCPRDPASDVKGALPQHRKRRMNAVSIPELPALVRAIDGYDGEPLTKFAMKLMLLTFVRTSELIKAEWAEINEGEALWTIPEARMKMGGEGGHLVPLSSEALGVLADARRFANGSKYIFSLHNRHKHMSNNTILYALYRLGYHGRMTGHGFRSVASTILNEEREKGTHNFGADVIEKQLAHFERDQVRGAYNRAAYLPARRLMMQWWADYLDNLSGIAQK
jgi:integrase